MMIATFTLPIAAKGASLPALRCAACVTRPRTRPSTAVWPSLERRCRTTSGRSGTQVPAVAGDRNGAPEQVPAAAVVAAAVPSQPTREGFLKAAAISVATALGAAVVAMHIDQFSNESCTINHTCDQISTVMKALLVGTHLYTFLLVPATMYVFYDKTEELREERARSPFTVMLGLSFIMIAIMGEMGWHIQQDWYYKEEYNILNLAFYFFLNSGLSAWAFGLRLNQDSDAITTASPFLGPDRSPGQPGASGLTGQPGASGLTGQPGATGLTGQPGASGLTGQPGASGLTGQPGASGLTGLVKQAGINIGDIADYFLLSAGPLTLGMYYLGAAEIHTKVPIYIMMSLIFTVLTWRFWQVLKTKWVLLFPLFSVGVNLSFIALLDKYQTDAFLNPLFHILHDAAGTEMGIAIIAVLTYLSPALEDTEEGKQQ